MSDDVRLRDVEEPDLEVFFEHQVDPEAARLAHFPSRDRERFMTHWRPGTGSGASSGGGASALGR